MAVDVPCEVLIFFKAGDTESDESDVDSGLAALAMDGLAGESVVSTVPPVFHDCDLEVAWPLIGSFFTPPLVCLDTLSFDDTVPVPAAPAAPCVPAGKEEGPGAADDGEDADRAVTTPGVGSSLSYTQTTSDPLF